MKNILFLVLFLFSFLGHAEIDSYKCVLSNESDSRSVEALRLRNFKDSILKVPFTQCSLTRDNASFDVCRLGKNSLVIGVNPLRSVLISKKGKAFEFSCREHDPEQDGQEQQQQQQQEQQQQQQQQQQEQEQQQEDEPDGEPGHGGSNIRMRGMRGEPGHGGSNKMRMIKNDA